MTTLREAAQRALKSLEEAIKVWTEEMEFRSCIDVSDEWLESYAALREALAQPDDHIEDHLEMVQPAPEPAAWMDRDGEVYKMPEIEGWAPPHALLYTHPPQRKPLTNEEIAALLAQSAGVDLKLNGGDLLFARAIDRAHGIGGEE